jgi:lysophospholipase L1-like esterase
MFKKNTLRFFTLLVVLALLVGAGLTSFTSAHASAIKIMPLGDSITGSPGCWRALLWNQLQSAGYTNFDFVGTLNNAGDCGVSFDGDNEGHGGYLATGIDSNNQLPAWLAATNPDVVMMQLGTNDVWNNIAPATILASFGHLVDEMRANNPNVRIMVAQITPLNPSGCADCPQRVINFNAAIPAWASAKSTTQSPITVVDVWTGFNTATDTADGCHPNSTTGIQKVAASWYPAVVAMLRNTPTSTPSYTPGGPTLTPSNTPTKTLTPTPTNTPIPNVTINMQGAGSDTTSLTTMNLQIVNTGIGGLTNLSWRLYFTVENSNAASTYVLEKYYDQSGVAITTGPTLACNEIYYYTISYGATALPVGTTWSYNTAMHLSSYATTYVSSNDYWRTGYATLPTAYIADTYIPAYINGVKFHGTEPTCGNITPSNTPVITNTPTKTMTPTVTLTRSLTPAITYTPTPTLTRTLTPVITLTGSVTRTPTRTVTAGITNTPTRTPTAGISPTGTMTNTPLPGASPTRTPTATVIIPDPTPTQTLGCSPVTSAITAPFTYDGAGTFCWQSSNLGAYINSWNLTSLTVNGVNETNIYVAAGSLPAKINGYWYVGYNSAVSYGHFEAK